jgi:hypothetical protein
MNPAAAREARQLRHGFFMGFCAAGLIEDDLRRWILRIRSLDFVVEHARGRRIAAALGKGEHFEHADTTVERNGQHVPLLDAMPRRLLADAVDADMTGLDQGGGAAAGFYHARVP